MNRLLIEWSLTHARVIHLARTNEQPNKVAEAGIQLAEGCLVSDGAPQYLASVTWPDVRPPSDLIRNGRETMHIPSPSDGLSIKWLFSQGSGRYTDLESVPTSIFLRSRRSNFTIDVQVRAEVVFCS